MKILLSIAGSDSGGGAGIQADIKTCEAFGLFATTAITAVTAQNTQGVLSIQVIDKVVVRDQIAAVLADFEVSAIKIGMLATEQIVDTVADSIASCVGSIPIVLDPVMVASSGAQLLDTPAVDVLRKKLMPLCTLVTPNGAEAAILAGIGPGDPVSAGNLMVANFSGSVLVTGGDSGAEAGGEVIDRLFSEGKLLEFSHARIQTSNIHGTGCTLSTAIAARLAKGVSLVPAIEDGRRYVRRAIAEAPGIGQGPGPLCHATSSGSRH